MFFLVTAYVPTYCIATSLQYMHYKRFHYSRRGLKCLILQRVLIIKNMTTLVNLRFKTCKMTTFDISCHAVYHDECKYRKGGEQSSDPLIRPTIAGIPHRGAAVIGMEKERKQAGYDQHGWQGDTEMVGAVCAANVRRIHYWIRRSIHHGRLPELLQVHYGYRRRVRRLKNYTRALQDKEFLHALGFSTLLTIVTTIVINVVAFSIAYMLTKAIKGSNIFRSVFFMPNLIGGIILGYIWMLLLNGILAHWRARWPIAQRTASGVWSCWCAGSRSAT